jgi:hypothetical protein
LREELRQRVELAGGRLRLSAHCAAGPSFNFSPRLESVHLDVDYSPYTKAKVDGVEPPEDGWEKAKGDESRYWRGEAVWFPPRRLLPPGLGDPALLLVPGAVARVAITFATVAAPGYRRRWRPRAVPVRASDVPRALGSPIVTRTEWHEILSRTDVTGEVSVEFDKQREGDATAQFMATVRVRSPEGGPWVVFFTGAEEDDPAVGFACLKLRSSPQVGPWMEEVLSDPVSARDAARRLRQLLE